MLNTIDTQTIAEITFQQIKAISLKNRFKSNSEYSNKDLKAIENAKKIQQLIFKE